MIKDVDNLEISRIHSTDTPYVYEISCYQREYAWGQHNWANLYDDVFDNDSGYFLGSIIAVEAKDDRKAEIISYEVIDGQQRLITISLLLAAIYTRIEKYNGVIDEERQVDDVRPLRNRLILKTDKSMTRVVPQIQNHNLDDYRWILKENVDIKMSMEREAKAQEIQKKYVHTLGNLTITGNNSKLSNKPFIEKRDHKDNNGTDIGCRNELNLNKDLVKIDSWTEDQIRARTAKLVDLALQAFTFNSIDF